jgi:hypothetical protein
VRLISGVSSGTINPPDAWYLVKQAVITLLCILSIIFLAIIQAARKYCPELNHTLFAALAATGPTHRLDC